MGQIQRAGYMDVSNTVDLSQPSAVRTAVGELMTRCYPAFDTLALDTLFDDFQRLYTGDFPGYRACDIRYHDSQHVLDVTLAMARLLDGHWRSAPSSGRLAMRHALAGVAAALFHDAGYIRRTRDTRNVSGAAYTRIHVARGARFLSSYLPGVGLGNIAGTCARIIRFTGYEVDIATLTVADEREFLLGTMLGTADLLAQMADINYARKCHDDLYEEFVAAGIAGAGEQRESEDIVYRSPAELLRMTPAFMDDTIDRRLDGCFNGVHCYAAAHFGGRHLYMEAIRENRRGLEKMLATGRL